MESRLLIAGLAPWLGSGVLAGSGTIHFAIFLAFCALHPGAQFFFGLSITTSQDLTPQRIRIMLASKDKQSEFPHTMGNEE